MFVIHEKLKFQSLWPLHARADTVKLHNASIGCQNINWFSATVDSKIYKRYWSCTKVICVPLCRRYMYMTSTVLQKTETKGLAGLRGLKPRKQWCHVAYSRGKHFSKEALVKKPVKSLKWVFFPLLSEESVLRLSYINVYRQRVLYVFSKAIGWAFGMVANEYM